MRLQLTTILRELSSGRMGISLYFRSMNDNQVLLLLLFVVVSFLSCGTSETDPIDPGWTYYVDPMIGTAGNGQTFPGVAVPFGAVQLGPDNGKEEQGNFGYRYEDSVIVGFSHTHFNGRGMGELHDLLLSPQLGSLDLSQGDHDSYAVSFSHANEEARAGHYQVLLDNGIKVELSATSHTGLHRYTFPEDAEKHLVLDLGYEIEPDKTRASGFRKESDHLFSGYRFSSGWAEDQRIFFAVEFSQKPESYAVYDSTHALSGDSLDAKRLRMDWGFKRGSEPVMVKVGVSTADRQGAIAALGEIESWDFQLVVNEAVQSWNNYLGLIEVKSDDESALRNFYTALYHTAFAPVVYEDVHNRYHSAKAGIVAADSIHRYDHFPLWYSHRSIHPLLTIVKPGMINDVIRSFLAHYEEHGHLPGWMLQGNDLSPESSHLTLPVMLDAYMKGFRDYDVELAYQAMKQSMTRDTGILAYYDEYGFLPADLAAQSVMKTMELAYSDWCMSQMAFLLGHEDDYQFFLSRAKSFENVFDPESRLVRPRNSDGRWVTPFDPDLADDSTGLFASGNAWQKSWGVPHDIARIKELQGGNEAFVQILDSIFEDPGMGMHDHAVVSSQHMPYLYNYAGIPWKTQERIRHMTETLYSDQPAGLSGVEGFGQMSSWLVMSAMGFYPVNPAEGIYVLGSPMFERVEIHLEDGQSFIIRGHYITEENKYVQSATLHEEPLTRSYIRHFEILQGGELHFEMGPLPNYLHWSDSLAYPPSMSLPIDI